MTSDGALERRYRRLLAWYPPEHRRRYGDEMIGVLMAAAPQGSKRPGLTGTLDLILGGLKARITGSAGRLAATDWPDALAICSVAIPVILAGYVVADWLFYVGRYPGAWYLELENSLVLLAVAGPVALALRYRRTAMVISFGLALWLCVYAAGAVAHGYLLAEGQVICGALGLLTSAIALPLSAGPRRAIALLTPGSWIVLGGSGLAMGLIRPHLWTKPIWTAAIIVAGTLVLIAVAIVRTIPSRISVGLLVLLAVPGYPGAVWAAGVSGPIGTDLGNFPDIVFLPTMLFACLAIVLVARSRRRSNAAISSR